MDGYLAALEARLKAIELHIWPVPVVDAPTDAQTLNPARMPAAPGLPIAPYDPAVHQDDATDAAIASEADNRINGTIRPDDIGNEDAMPADEQDPTLNDDGTPRRRKRASSDD